MLVRGSAIVHIAAVSRPGPGPTQMSPRSIRPVGAASPGAIISVLRVDAAIKPATAGGRSIVLELLEAFDLAALGPSVAVDLLQHRIGRRFFLFPFGGIIPRQCGEPEVLGVRAAGVELLQPAAEMKNEPGFRAAVARPADNLLVPLQKAMGIRD